MQIPESFVWIQGGSFQMGSPESEAWRSDDETQHTVTVSGYYMSKYELTQKEYEEVMGSNPSNFKGEHLPVENVSWLDAVAYCNARSERDGLTPVYTIDGQTVSWDRSANGYRLPTEAEWEYACRAGTDTPFYMESSPSAEDANYYGHYPYEIEDHYFSQGNLEVKPGRIPANHGFGRQLFRKPLRSLQYARQCKRMGVGLLRAHIQPKRRPTRRVPPPARFGFTAAAAGTTSLKTCARRIGPRWNRIKAALILGIRLVLNAEPGSGSVSGTGEQTASADGNGRILIAYFSWGGNTRGIAEEIRRQTGADLFEITMVNPYSSDYNTVLDEAQRDQNAQARPELAAHIENMDEYDIVMLGYPNWWASIPMPVASFLEEYDFSGKTILPFCSHGGGRFGQSLTAIAKLAQTPRWAKRFRFTIRAARRFRAM